MPLSSCVLDKFHDGALLGHVMCTSEGLLIFTFLAVQERLPGTTTHQETGFESVGFACVFKVGCRSNIYNNKNNCLWKQTPECELSLSFLCTR